MWFNRSLHTDSWRSVHAFFPRTSLAQINDWLNSDAVWRFWPLSVTCLPRWGCCGVTSLPQLGCGSGRGGTPSGSHHFHTRRFPLFRQSRGGRYRPLAERVNTAIVSFRLKPGLLRCCRCGLAHTHVRASVFAMARTQCPFHFALYWPQTWKKVLNQILHFLWVLIFQLNLFLFSYRICIYVWPN